MKTDCGGWTVFHKRFDGLSYFTETETITRTGLVTSEESFGLETKRIHQPTEIPSQLRVEINTTSYGNKYAKYNDFTVTNEASNYTLFGDSGDAEDKLTPHNSIAFFTKGLG